jgi:hypothetical protein
MTITDRTRLVRVQNAPSHTSDDDDVSDIMTRCSQWRKAFRDEDVAYPATLLAIPRAANWVRDRGYEVTARSPQGIAFAMFAGVHPARVMFHCANATGRTINDAITLGIGQFILDSPKAAAMAGACADQPQNVLVDVTDGEAAMTIAAALAEENLTLIGLHSEGNDPELAVMRMFEHMADVRCRRGLRLTRIGVALHGGLSTSPETQARLISESIEEGCARFRLPRPALTVFPNWLALTHNM